MKQSALLDSLNKAQVRAVKHKEGPIQVLSCAGSGKTRVITHRIAYLISHHGIDPSTVLAVTFTKKAANEMESRLVDLIGADNLRALNIGTFHSACFRILRNEVDWFDPTMQRFNIIEEWQAVKLMRDIANKVSSFTPLPPPAELLKLVSRTKNELLRPDDVRRLDALPFRTEHKVSTTDFAEAYALYEEHKRAQGKYDFDDLLMEVHRMFAENDGIRLAYSGLLDYFLIDEFQDTNRAQFEIIRQLCNDDGNLMVVGDDDQCHPPGVMVRLADGSEKRIEELSRDDYVKPWHRNAQRSLGKRSIQIASRPYHGSLFTAVVGSKSVPMTPNHRLLVRWADRHSKICVTYLMWREGFGFRVGWCQLFNAEGAFHLGQRSRLEKADRVWILKVHEDRIDASVYESIVAAKYGIPTIVFEPRREAPHYTKDSISKIFASVSDENFQHGIVALTDHSRYFDYPFYPFPHAHIGGNIRGTYFEVFACNLMPGLLRVPLPNGRNNWQTINAVQISEYQGQVYSLDVEEDHTYSANGVIVLNSVYSWRGAVPSYTIQFKDHFPTAVIVRMETNYRSCPGIIATANKLIAHNKNRLEKKAKANRTDKGLVTAFLSTTEYYEAETICAEIEELRKAGDEGGAATIAVLYRTNAQSRVVEDTLVHAGIPYTIVGSLGFYNRKEIRDILAYLRVVEFDEDESLIRVINRPSRYLGKAFLSELSAVADKHHCTLFKAISMGAGTFSKPYMTKRSKEFSRTIWALKDSRKELSPEEMIAALRDLVDYDSYLMENEVEEDPDNSRVQNLEELQTAAKGFTSLREFLTFAESMQAKGRDNGEADGTKTRVELLTLHRAKGLEWDTVFIAGLSDGLLPHVRAESLEEERRLFYVGVTRSREQLFLSSLATYHGRFLPPSRFLHEAGLELNTKEVRVVR